MLGHRARVSRMAVSCIAMASFKDGPLVAIDHDGNLSRIQDNSNLNSIIAHDKLEINEKHKTQYAARINAFLYLGTNKPVKISDAYSGLVRRLIDVHPTGRTHTPERYDHLKTRMDFELGAIAHHCVKVYRTLGKNYYSSYRPVRMMFATNALHNFVDHYYFEFRDSEYVTLSQAFDWYKAYMEEANERFPLPKTEFREELRAYFEDFEERTRKFEGRLRNVYTGFKKDLFDQEDKPVEVLTDANELVLDKDCGLLDDVLKDQPAQYASEFGRGTPVTKWDQTTTVLSDLDTSRLHYVKPPSNHIVIDFDLTDEEGNKSADLNLAAAAEWPATYAEFSKSRAGVHLHYNYVGNVDRLSRVFAPGIEIKVFVGDASLRRLGTSSNGLPIATLTSGLPLREGKVLNAQEVKTEIGLRRLIEKNLQKLVHPGTKPSMDFIHKIMNDAYKSSLVYDLTDMKSRIVSFAMNSTNQSVYCLKLANDIPFRSKQDLSEVQHKPDDRMVIFDVEVFPNLFVVCWMYEDDPGSMVRMINPTAAEVGALLDLKLVGFNNRKYDNHILYARYMGYTNEQLFELSKGLIDKNRSPFMMAYGISYCDIYDYLSEKKSLKKWQIELGLNHLELGLPWDQPVPEEMIDTVAEYCANDVITTDELRKARHADFVARQILAELSGLPVNSSTNQHSTHIIFGDEKRPQSEFNYVDLSTEFPGYTFNFGKSSYRGYDPSEGGFVDAEPGMYANVTVFDVASMHPSSIIAMNMFGDNYTPLFKDLLDVRLAIKNKDYDAAGKMLGGKIEKYLSDPDEAKGLSNALKIVINSVYGLTSARFENPFRDPRNVDNIVAKRGALFMIDLMLAVRDKGFQVVHIKTDSIKVVDATPELEAFIFEFGRTYGYSFEVEERFEKFCLVNNAVYIAYDTEGRWEAVGAQFKHPVVYKTLFTKEPVTFNDYVEVKSVTTSLWLDFGGPEKQFVGRAGGFVPVISGGGDLLRLANTGEYTSASGAKGYKWKEAIIEKAESNGRYDNIDQSYFTHLCDQAIAEIAKFGDPEWILG